MKKVKLFYDDGITVIDLGQNLNSLYQAFRVTTFQEVVAEVVKVIDKVDCVLVKTDFRNPCHDKNAEFLLTKKNYAKVRWVE